MDLMDLIFLTNCAAELPQIFLHLYDICLTI